MNDVLEQTNTDLKDEWLDCLFKHIQSKKVPNTEHALFIPIGATSRNQLKRIPITKLEEWVLTERYGE